MDDLPSRIAEARRAAGLSQALLADRVGVAQSSIAQWETGARQPTVRDLARAADELRVSLDWLCGRCTPAS